jgi:AmmeMemoRadiSam system protein B/AmmeMemoRadiSam system protein A
MNIRKPAVAGRFYPGKAKELKNQISGFFSDTKPKPGVKPAALLVPHAGYVFSGRVAAEAFGVIPSSADYKRIFVIGSSHTLHFDGASVFSGSHYKTPLGDLIVDRDVVKHLKKERHFDFIPEAHHREHSLEVQMPFIQYLWKDRIPVVPILLGDLSSDEIGEVAVVLSPWFTEDNLFVISTDFSHFPEYEDALIQDRLTAEAIEKNNAALLEKRLDEAKRQKVDNLATPLCGWTSVLTLLKITEKKAVDYRKLLYRNSGDSPYGNHREVVGYWAMSVEWRNPGKRKFDLSETEKRTLLHIARQALEFRLQKSKKYKVPDNFLTHHLQEKVGVFVSVYVADDLRGCIGSMTGRKPLFELVGEMVLSAALDDDRFKSVSRDEIPEVKIEISVLTPGVKVQNVDEIIPGKHGVYITNGWQKGTLLPQVGEKMNWTTEELLGHCARDKAGMSWEGWKNADIYKYEAIIFKE